MLFRKMFLSLLSFWLVLLGLVSGALFILFLTVVLWSISGYAVGALFGALCILFFAAAWFVLRVVSQSGKKQLDIPVDSKLLQEAKQVMPMNAARIEREFFKNDTA